MQLVMVDAAVAVVGVQAAAVGGAWLLRSREPLLQRYLPHLLSLAVGVLLTTALLDLMPEAIAQLGNRRLTWLLLAGSMLALFAVERVFSALTGSSTEPEVGEFGAGTHVHRHAPGRAEHSAKPMNLVLAAMLHSFVDGTVLATAFVASPRIGWLTAVAIALHEVPHRIGDFAVLIHLRQSSRRALQLAALAGVPSLLGVAMVLAAGANSTRAVAYLLPVSAGSFLYIATVNLLPEIQQECRVSRVLWQLVWLAIGAGIVALVVGLSGG
ncbi:MAG: ZIP family metal transporter [Acidobacteriaceae bacterium]